MISGFDNYLDTQLTEHTKQLDRQDAREEAIKAFITHGKDRILGNQEFCRLSFSDFGSFYFGDFHEGRAADGLLKFLMDYDPDQPHVTQKLLSLQAFAYSALDSFMDEQRQRIEAEFDREMTEAA
ncbi:hypothetical protein [Salinivibrio sp. YCSC6]|uniref:hypothetical protein n=1 Tax=Salinivibrio sp. YCSC6 TaxID=2003370 RepID=UPI000BBBD22B|nr:hypothetical protein [Salinivibrio sp. YCSC6]PCE67571.1 hypothetical protein B6G00_04275 [Salinivibrio sp. YCSC6]QCF35525.1 hypothetical protein E8E00_04685 [Salinivibrio sp. YCSC6]